MDTKLKVAIYYEYRLVCQFETEFEQPERKEIPSHRYPSCIRGN